MSSLFLAVQHSLNGFISGVFIGFIAASFKSMKDTGETFMPSDHQVLRWRQVSPGSRRWNNYNTSRILNFYRPKQDEYYFPGAAQQPSDTVFDDSFIKPRSFEVVQPLVDYNQKG